MGDVVESFEFMVEGSMSDAHGSVAEEVAGERLDGELLVFIFHGSKFLSIGRQCLLDFGFLFMEHAFHGLEERGHEGAVVLFFPEADGLSEQLSQIDPMGEVHIQKLLLVLELLAHVVMVFEERSGAVVASSLVWWSAVASFGVWVLGVGDVSLGVALGAHGGDEIRRQRFAAGAGVGFDVEGISAVALAEIECFKPLDGHPGRP